MNFTDKTFENDDIHSLYASASLSYAVEETFSDSVFAYQDESILFANLTPEEVQPAYFEIEPVYRSAALVLPGQYNHDCLFDDYVVPEALEMPSYGKKKFSNVTDCVFSGLFEQQFNYQTTADGGPTVSTYNNTKLKSDNVDYQFLVAPETPYLLLNTHFEVKMSLVFIVEMIKSFLEDTDGISYEFDTSRVEWTIVGISTSSSCRAQIHVYAGEKSFIVEANRLRGDSTKFRSLFNQLKNRFIPVDIDMSKDFDIFTKTTHLPESTIDPSLEDISKGVDTLLRMAKCVNTEAQCEAAKALCEAALNETMQVHLCDHNVVEVLRSLLYDSVCPWAKHHAMVVLSQLSDSKVCVESIIEGGVLPKLLELSTDGSYETAELRRLAAHVLAKLSMKMSKKVVSALDKKELARWMNSVDSIHDERLKIHGILIKDNLSSSIAAF